MNRFLLLVAMGWAMATSTMGADLTLYDGGAVPVIIHDDRPTATLAADMLAGDIEALTGQKARTSTHLSDCTGVCILIGPADAAVVRQMMREEGVVLEDLSGQWERYERRVIPSKRHPGRTYVVITGSDRRGAVWGVSDLSRELGVSPWSWWADVTPRRVTHLSIDGEPVVSAAPAVKYRGVFLNDEDWGLEPWAAKTFDPAYGNIGPKTYSRVYELMWRLKANTIWPAMHDVSSPFYRDPNNAKLADAYAIVVSTSHAEPMGRNNVREWDEKKRGPFDWTQNRAAMLDYWRQRVGETKDFETLYTIGLRGLHDGPLQGADTAQARRDIMAEAIGEQRRMLPAGAAQQMVLYKEVLEAYSAGLKVPDDVTLVWCDDNYGYISRLPDAAERKRSGGSGVYYHLSYWGRPHDYLWLGTTHPGLIREQMGRAYATGARQIWIANIGDIKPAEYLTSYFLDLAFSGRFEETPKAHLRVWMAEQFGDAAADEATNILMGYYDLAFERRPEFMGFSQTEPTTPVRPSDYVQGDDREAQARIAAYDGLVKRAKALGAALPADRQDAFFELVLYPVRAAANMNTRTLKLDLAALYGRNGRTASSLVTEARAAHQGIVADTALYNSLNDGKWRGMMDMAPRRQAVFAEPLWPDYPQGTSGTVRRGNPDRVVVPTAETQGFERIDDLGSQGQALRAPLDGTAASATYSFTATEGGGVIRVVALPTHALTADGGVRVKLSLDDGPEQLVDFATVGRSDQWRFNVLSNTAIGEVALKYIAAGPHTIRLTALDPGVIIDRVEIDLDGAMPHYGVLWKRP